MEKLIIIASNNPSPNTGGDSYNRRLVSRDTFQCGCKWVRMEDYGGDVLVECLLHKQATLSFLDAHDGDLVPNLMFRFEDDNND